MTAITQAEFTPVTPVTGGLVHAVRRTGTKTLCGRPYGGWRVSLSAELLSCALCRSAILEDR